MEERVKIDASVLCEMIERLEKKVDRIGERIEKAPEVIGLDETNRLLGEILERIDMLGFTRLALTGEALIHCLEAEGLSTFYHVISTAELAPGDTVTMTVTVPDTPNNYCVASSVRVDTDKYKVIKFVARIESKRGLAKKETFLTDSELSQINVKFPLGFIFCQPRDKYIFEFTSTEPAGGDTVWVKIWLQCSVVSEDVYFALKKSFLDPIVEYMRVVGGLAR